MSVSITLECPRATGMVACLCLHGHRFRAFDRQYVSMKFINDMPHMQQTCTNVLSNMIVARNLALDRFYVDIGLLEGAPRTFGGFLVHNLVPVTLGNAVGGGVFLGLVQWATYDTTRKGYLPVGDVESVMGDRSVEAAGTFGPGFRGSLNNAGSAGLVPGVGNTKSR